MTTVLDKAAFKSTLKELAKNETNELLEMLEEVKEDIEKFRRRQLENIVNEDFAEYESVFRALA
jgi:3-methyladenine DNA glycosylase AlkC